MCTLVYYRVIALPIGCLSGPCQLQMRLVKTHRGLLSQRWGWIHVHEIPCSRLFTRSIFQIDPISIRDCSHQNNAWWSSWSGRSCWLSRDYSRLRCWWSSRSIQHCNIATEIPRRHLPQDFMSIGSIMDNQNIEMMADLICRNYQEGWHERSLKQPP